MNNTKSQETVKHTALPWAFKHANDGTGAFRISGKGMILADAWFISQYTTHAPTMEEAEANARFIVKAVNCHDDLLAALQRLFNCVPLSVEGPHPDSKIQTSVAYWRGAFDQAKAALEKASAL